MAFYVHDLQEAGKFYQDLFDMELIGREVEMEPYQITWHIAFDPGFRIAGEYANQWLEL